MANGSNLKAKVGMDTGDFEKGAKRVTKAAQGMGKDIGGSLSEVSRSLGINIGLLGDLSKRISDATTLFRGMANAGGNAASSLTKAMTGLGGAIAGLGITAAIVAFRELNQEAQNFEQRLQGVNLAASAKAYRETYRQALDDSSGRGEQAATWWEGFRNNFARDWANITHPFASQEDQANAERAGQAAADLASEMVDLRRRERDLGIEIQQINNEILAAQNTFRDTSKDVNERKAAEATITERVTQKYAKQIALQQEMLDNVRKRNSLTTSTEAELDEEANLERGILSLQGQMQQELNAMLRTSNSIAGASKSHASSAKETQQATELTLAAATELVKQERALKAIQDQNDAMKAAARFALDADKWGLPGIETPGNLQASAVGLTVPALIKPVVDAEAAKLAMIDLTDTVLDSAMSMSEALGGLIGDLLTGGDAWGNFTSAALSSFADLAISVGKMAVATGAATAGIKAALESLNPYVAMAAGAALIALGAAVKSGMANLASGGYASAPSVASSSYSSGSLSAGSVAQTVNVRVTGTLTGEGSKLKAVLNNENTRLATTT